MRIAHLVTAEHARWHVPADLDLGIDPRVLETHTAWDPGAQEMAEAVARDLGAPLLLGNYTRLVADLNRSPHNPEAVPEVAFGVEVPGNKGLSAEAREHRLRTFHHPYWSRSRELLRPLFKASEIVVHLSIHSFTPEYRGQKRDLDVGILFDPRRSMDTRFAEACLHRVRELGFTAKANEPYSGLSDGLSSSLRSEFPEKRFVGIELEASHRLLRPIVSEEQEDDCRSKIVSALVSVAREGSWVR